MKLPLTQFIIALLRTDPARLASADPAKLAAKYNIRTEHAAGFLRLRGG